MHIFVYLTFILIYLCLFQLLNMYLRSTNTCHILLNTYLNLLNTYFILLTTYLNLLNTYLILLSYFSAHIYFMLTYLILIFRFAYLTL